MEIINFLPLSIYEFTCDEALVDRIASTVSELPTRKNANNKVSINDIIYDEELHTWFNSCIEEVKKKLYIPDDVKLEITSCWSTVAKKLQMHHQHSHANSFLSGLLYLTDGHSGGKTEFITDNIWWNDFQWLMFADGQGGLRKISQQYAPLKGKLLLFPSSLQHRVTAVTDNSPRYSISFNTFFSGMIAGSVNLARLEIKSKSVTEYNET